MPEELSPSQRGRRFPAPVGSGRFAKVAPQSRLKIMALQQVLTAQAHQITTVQFKAPLKQARSKLHSPGINRPKDLAHLSICPIENNPECLVRPVHDQIVCFLRLVDGKAMRDEGLDSQLTTVEQRHEHRRVIASTGEGDGRSLFMCGMKFDMKRIGVIALKADTPFASNESEQKVEQSRIPR